jgi:Immunity protein 35
MSGVMINQQQARELVYEEINKPDPYWPDKPEMIILDERTVEKDFGWVFYWTSRPWHETGDFQQAIVGNGPIIISREGGSLYECGASPLEEDRIREQEDRLKSDLTKKKVSN